MRLIDESELIDIIQGSEELLDFQKAECIKCIKACDTAYDPDKVVEQLGEEKNLHEEMIKYEQKNGTVTEEFQARRAVEVLERAIEIVKGGGAE